MIPLITGPCGELTVGPGFPTRVMALIGASNPGGFSDQLHKIEALADCASPPDIIADLSILDFDSPLWRQVLNAGFVAAALPIYTAKRRNSRIDPKELLDIAIQLMEGGVGLLTIHPTPTRELIATAMHRRVPWTSRGGGIVIDDLLGSGTAENVYMQILPDLVCYAARYRTTLSIGASFRSANIFDSMDVAQRVEIEGQIELAADLNRAGVTAIIESPGHARPSDIRRCAQILRESGFPIMPLGPIPTDASVGQDHVSAAIGASLMGIEGAAHILAAVTREEHTGGIPTVDSTVEAIEAARVAAHVIDLHMLGDDSPDDAIVRLRQNSKTCVAGKLSPGCSRCGPVCPLH